MRKRTAEIYEALKREFSGMRQGDVPLPTERALCARCAARCGAWRRRG